MYKKYGCVAIFLTCLMGQGAWSSELDVEAPNVMKEFRRAVAYGEFEVVQKMLAEDAYVKNHIDETDEGNWTALHFATFFGGIDIMKILLDLGANPNALTIYGYAPLYFAQTQYNAEKRRELLLYYGASVIIDEDVFKRYNENVPPPSAASGLENEAEGADHIQCNFEDIPQEPNGLFTLETSVTSLNIEEENA